MNSNVSLRNPKSTLSISTLEIERKLAMKRSHPQRR